MELEQTIPLNPLSPTLKTVSFFHPYKEYDEEYFSNNLEGSMMRVFMNKHHINYCYRKSLLPDKKPFLITDGNKSDIFTVYEEESLPQIDCIPLRSYADKLPMVGEIKYGTVSMIYVFDDKVTVSLDSTYKYEEWCEIAEHLYEDCEGHDARAGIWGKMGLRKAFVLLTNLWAGDPIFQLYDYTLAGFLVDKDSGDITFFDNISAILIHHELFHLCEQQELWHFKKIDYDNSNLADSSNPYVQRFLALLEKYHDDFKLSEAIERYYDVERHGWLGV